MPGDGHAGGEVGEHPRPPAPTPGVAPAAQTSQGQSQAGGPLAVDASAQPPKGPEKVAETPVPFPTVLRALATLAILFWGLGLALLVARFLHGSWRVRRLRRRVRPLDPERWGAELEAAARALGVVRLPAVCLSPDVRGPVVAGLFPPRVVLPEALPERSTPQLLVVVLLHECAHVLRRDPWVRLLQRLAAVVYWPHPLVHLLNRRLDQAREEVCDNHVLAHTDAPSYAEALLTVSQACYPTPRLEGYLTMMPRQYPLERRVADLLKDRRDTATLLTAWQRAAVVTALGLLLVSASSIGLRGAAPAGGHRDEAAPARATDGEKVTGTVEAADGSPAGGAVVWAAKNALGPLQRREADADAQGRFTLNLPPGTWTVWGRKGTQGGESTGPYGRVEVVAGQSPPAVVVRLEERGTFRGRLQEAESGKPIPGGRLYLDAGLVLTADANGRFEIGGLSRTHHEAFVVAAGRMRLRVLFDTTARETTELDVPVPRAGKIVGRVTDVDGKPIPGAYVGRSTSGNRYSLTGLYVACDGDGRFEYDDAVPAGQSTWLGASAPGYIDEDKSDLHAPPGGKPLVMNFRLRAAPGTPKGDFAPDAEKRRPVSGVVKGSDGKPAVGVLVRWGYQPYYGATETRTDAEGRFRFMVPDKADMLAVLPADHPPEFPRVASGGKKEVEVKLRAGKTVRGVARDDAGKPIRGVRVVVQVPSPDPRIGNPYWLSESSVYTDAAGRFEVRGVPERARFDFMKSGLSGLRSQALDLDRADNAVTMQFGGAVSGRVVDRDGTPIRNFRVLVGFPRDRRPGDKTDGYFAGYSGMGVRFTSDDGTFVLTGVGAGSVYRIKALADGHGEAVAERLIALPVNRVANNKPATLRAGPPVKFRVRAVDADGKLIPDARVTLVDGDPQLDKQFSWGYDDATWDNMARARAAADGWADFPALTFGEATLLVRAPGFGRHWVGWRGKEKELSCKLAKEAVVAGEVLGPDGKPRKDCYVQLRREQGDSISAHVGASDKGRFRVSELPAGKWEVAVYGDNHAILHQETVTLKAGETKDLAIKTRKE
ncbi:MAG: M56 family metallopeptidase [Gemmataceae bacterium]